MFFFKCCSNNSLPNFLKSSKSLGKGQPNESPLPNLNGSCSNEVLDGSVSQSAEALNRSTDVDDGRHELKIEASSAENLDCEGKPHEEYRHRLVISSVKRPPKEIHSSSSNSIVLLVGKDRVKTSLLKHCSSCDFAFNSENARQRNGRRLVRNDGKTSSAVVTLARQFSASEADDEKFAFEALQAVCIDRTETVFSKSSKRRTFTDDEVACFVVPEKQNGCINCLKTREVFECQGRRAEGSAICGNLILINDSESLTSTCPDESNSQNILEKSIDGGQRDSDVEARPHQESADANHRIEANDSLFSRADEPSDALKQAKTSQVVSELLAGGFCENISSLSKCDTVAPLDTKRVKLGRGDSRGVESSPLKREGLTQILTGPREVNVIPYSVASCPTFINGGRTMQPSRMRCNASIDVLFAGETASYLEEFLPRDDLQPSTQFATLNGLTSPSTSDDSTRNADDETTSHDSLLSDKSSDAAPACRPRDLSESQVVFSSSPDDDLSDGSPRNNSDNNSATDSLLGSPDYPGGGLDFRHFYSKSLPNLDRQPYDGITSLGLIEEYFNRYVVECDDGGSKCCGSQVDPVACAPTDGEDFSGKACADDQNRQHSLEKLTEICKKFSSTYLNFLHSTRGADADVVTLNSDCSGHAPGGKARLDPVDGKDQAADTNALSAFYAAVFSHHDSSEFSRVKTASTGDGPEDQVPTRKPSLAGRSVSLRDTPDSGAKKIVKKKKAVKFADSFGLELAIVRLILSGENLSDQDFQQRFQASGMQHCGNNRNNDALKNNPTKQTDTRKIVSAFVQPESSEDFLQRVEAQNVTLESCLPEEKSRSVSGCVRVKNLSYEKSIVVRYTLNDWLSYNETAASYVFGSSDGRTDRFSFSIRLPSFFDVGSAVEFAVVYRTPDGGEFWDNNGGANYRMTCQKC